MESEPTPIESPEPVSSEPASSGEMSPEAARAEINQTLSDARRDQHHPYTSNKYGGHKEAVARMAKLHEIAHSADGTPGPEVGADGSPLVNQPGDQQKKSMYEALEGHAATTEEQQEKLRDAADAELDILENEFDYQRPPVGDDLDEAHLRTFKMYRLAEQNDTVELPIMLEKELKSLGADNSAIKLFQQYRDAKDLHPELRRDVALLACRYVQQGHKNRRAAEAQRQKQE